MVFSVDQSPKLPQIFQKAAEFFKLFRGRTVALITKNKAATLLTIGALVSAILYHLLKQTTSKKESLLEKPLYTKLTFNEVEAFKERGIFHGSNSGAAPPIVASGCLKPSSTLHNEGFSPVTGEGISDKISVVDSRKIGLAQGYATNPQFVFNKETEIKKLEIELSSKQPKLESIQSHISRLLQTGNYAEAIKYKQKISALKKSTEVKPLDNYTKCLNFIGKDLSETGKNVFKPKTETGLEIPYSGQLMLSAKPQQIMNKKPPQYFYAMVLSYHEATNEITVLKGAKSDGNLIIDKIDNRFSATYLDNNQVIEIEENFSPDQVVFKDCVEQYVQMKSDENKEYNNQIDKIVNLFDQQNIKGNDPAITHPQLCKEPFGIIWASTTIKDRCLPCQVGIGLPGELTINQALVLDKDIQYAFTDMNKVNIVSQFLNENKLEIRVLPIEELERCKVENVIHG